MVSVAVAVVVGVWVGVGVAVVVAVAVGVVVWFAVDVICKYEQNVFFQEKDMNEPSLHDWQYERESKIAFDLEVAREAELKDAVQDRIGDLMLASGHGKDEQALMNNVLSTLAESQTAYCTVKRYLFEIWKLRDARTDNEKCKRDRAAQVIANMIAPILRDIVESEVSKEFTEA